MLGWTVIWVGQVLIEHNYINCGDDHVTILSGVGVAGQVGH
jgi:hypothetical protein